VYKSQPETLDTVVNSSYRAAFFVGAFLATFFLAITVFLARITLLTGAVFAVVTFLTTGVALLQLLLGPVPPVPCSGSLSVIRQPPAFSNSNCYLVVVLGPVPPVPFSTCLRPAPCLTLTCVQDERPLTLCVRAEAATLFAAFDDFGFARILAVFDATDLDVTSPFFAIA